MRPDIKDDELVDAVEQAAIEHGSKTDAIRHAIEQQLVDDSDDGGEQKINDDLRPELKKAHRILWDLQPGDHLSMPAALSVLAQKMGIEKSICKNMYIKPLEKENMLETNWGMSKVSLTVRDPDETVDADEVTNDTDTKITVDDPDDADEQIERAAVTDGGSDQ